MEATVNNAHVALHLEADERMFLCAVAGLFGTARASFTSFGVDQIPGFTPELQQRLLAKRLITTDSNWFTVKVASLTRQGETLATRLLEEIVQARRC